MSDKSEINRYLKVIPSDTISIPFPGQKVVSGTASATTASKLVMATADFEEANVLIGDIVYNNTDDTIAVVTSVDSETQLGVSADIFANGEDFVIYRSRLTGAAGGNRTSFLFVGIGGDLSVVNASGDVEIFKNLADGSYHPINAVRVNSTGTTADGIIALW